jgi:putative hydrolase of the HAD superfamily
VKLEAILLDALGTLIELDPPAPRLQAELEARFGVAVSQAQAQRAFASEIRFYRCHLDEGRDAASLERLREQCAGEIRGALPASVRRRLPPASELVGALLASLHFSPYPDVAPALGHYRDRGLRLVVVSNWDISLHAVLEHVGLATRLDGVLTAAEAGVRKPAPGIFRQALGLAGVEPGHALHVGDSLEEDVAGARAAGIEPVLVSRSRRPVAGVRTIGSLADPLL